MVHLRGMPVAKIVKDPQSRHRMTGIVSAPEYQMSAPHDRIKVAGHTVYLVTVTLDGYETNRVLEHDPYRLQETRIFISPHSNNSYTLLVN
jgi:hypothetical protein